MANELSTYNRSEKDFGVRFLQSANQIFARVYHQITVHSPCRIPRTGPAILVSNHTSSFDPMIIQSSCPRIIRWMMAKEYFGYKAMQGVFNTVGVILVDRGARDMAATRAAMRALEHGYVLGVFPEGRIETSRDFLPFQAGIGLLALKSGAPVFPAYLDGTQRMTSMVQAVVQSNNVSLSYGERIHFTREGSGRQQMDQMTKQIHDAILALRKTRESR